MCFGNMLRSVKIKKETISIAKEQSRHNTIQLYLANQRISVSGSSLKLLIEKQLFIYVWLHVTKPNYFKPNIRQIRLIDTSINSEDRVQSSSKVDKFLKLLLFFLI